MAGLAFGLSWLVLACLGLSWLVLAIRALRCLAVQINPGLDPGPRKTNFGPKRVQNCTLFMKTIEENQSLKLVQFVKLHL